jgi:twin BRCT domain
LRLGKRLDERPYLLPNPEILQNSKIAVRHFNNKDIVGASTLEPTALPTLGTSPSTSRKQSRVLVGKRVMLSHDLEIGSHLRGKLEELIEGGGGSVTGSVHKAHLFICRYREGEDYKTASRECVDVGTLAWLYHLITHNTWSSPYRKLLHYPVARAGLPGFQNYKISLSNYSGEARIYLENLVIAAGGEVTKTLKPPPDNTHLITAHGKSEKVNAARDWGIEVVNHLWLEESYAKWAVQPVSTSRYTHFPQRTNLEEVVGQTKIDRVALERNFFADEADDGNNEMEQVTVARVEVPRPIKAKDGNMLPGLVPASSAFESPRRTATATVIRVPASGGPTPKASRINSRVTELRTPVASRFVSDGKENHTPGTGSSRKAKDVATTKLHDYAPDLALYEKEKKRVGGVIYGGPRPKENKTSKGHDRKRSLDDGNTTSATEGHDMKRRKGPMPPASMHLMLSGYKRWLAGSGHNEIADRVC